MSRPSSLESHAAESMPLLARGLGEGAGEEGPAGAGGPVDQDDLMRADSVAAGEAEHNGAIEASAGRWRSSMLAAA